MVGGPQTLNNQVLWSRPGWGEASDPPSSTCVVGLLSFVFCLGWTRGPGRYLCAQRRWPSLAHAPSQPTPLAREAELS